MKGNIFSAKHQSILNESKEKKPITSKNLNKKSPTSFSITKNDELALSEITQSVNELTESRRISKSEVLRASIEYMKKVNAKTILDIVRKQI